MKTTVEALQDYYVEAGGQLADVADITTIPDMIDAITALGGGGSSLPAVTSDDNGDILGVVEGAWAKMDAPSALPNVTAEDNGDILGVVEGEWAKIDAPSGGAEYFNGTISGTTFTLGDNKHLSDIKAAIDAGKVVMLNDGGNNNYYYTLVRYRASEGLFSAIVVLGTAVHIKQIVFASWGSSATTGTYSDTEISIQ